MDRSDDQDQGKNEREAPRKSAEEIRAERISRVEDPSVRKQLDALQRQRAEKIADIREQHAQKFEGRVQELVRIKSQAQNSPQPRPSGMVPARKSPADIEALSRVEVRAKERAFENQQAKPIDEKSDRLLNEYERGRGVQTEPQRGPGVEHPREQPGREASAPTNQPQQSSQDKSANLDVAREAYNNRRNPDGNVDQSKRLEDARGTYLEKRAMANNGQQGSGRYRELKGPSKDGADRNNELNKYAAARGDKARNFGEVKRDEGGAPSKPPPDKGQQSRDAGDQMPSR